MASTILPIKPVVVMACNRKPEVSNRKGSTTSPNWWAPVFGWSTEPDYIQTGPDSGPKSRPAFTEEKAKQLRKMMTETTAFHDAMYHSSIAAKLASDFSDSSSAPR